MIAAAKSMLATLMLALSVGAVAAEGVRIKDLGRFDGARDNQLVGYGLVTGLAGTGDSQRSRTTRQSISNLLEQFDVAVPKEQVQSRNVASVMIIATLPPYARRGDKLDVTVTSMGDAKSLAGGTLLMTPLKGPDNAVHALAQGPLSIGGYRYDLNGNVVQKNHPTVGIVPAGASVELGVKTNVVEGGRVTFVLGEPDYETAVHVAEAVSRRTGGGARAVVRDPSSVDIYLDPRELAGNPSSLLMQIENLSVEPGTSARVVVNERTGTVIAGGDVKISSVTISHGDLKVSISTDYLVSQPILLRQTGPNIRTEVVPRTTIDVDEAASGNVIQANNTVADLIRALNRIKTSPRDMIAILQGIKTAGALHADLIIQ